MKKNEKEGENGLRKWSKKVEGGVGMRIQE